LISLPQQADQILAKLDKTGALLSPSNKLADICMLQIYISYNFTCYQSHHSQL